MSHHFRENNEVYQGFILSQVILETPCFEAYKMACRLRKEDISYRDFEYIYMQFAGGHTELDVVVPFVLRKVSKFFKEAVDGTTHHCKKFKMLVVPDCFQLTIDGYLVKYDFESNEISSGHEQIVTVHFCQNSFEAFEAAMTDIKVIMKNLTIDWLEIFDDIDDDNDTIELLFRVLQEVHEENLRDFRVTKLSIHLATDTHHIPLSAMMDSSFLKEVELGTHLSDNQVVPVLFAMDQWRNLENVVVRMSVPFDFLVMMAQLKRFEVNALLTVKEAQQLIQALSISDTFVGCKITCYDSILTATELARVVNLGEEGDKYDGFSHRVELDNGAALLISAEQEEEDGEIDLVLWIRKA
ncbi:hypothetical protein CAEBREN_17238 [Caenorhabditis brenneri]|uniref:DUF38 domain-containing protein n=1 Tax=Caenorhabditis brenneri TaxID=135651 RepID=G0P8G0_CAEBE|nr:hypothetical protein CAEBREN_17238 [Caenorhabditis brenneri]